MISQWIPQIPEEPYWMMLENHHFDQASIIVKWAILLQSKLFVYQRFIIMKILPANSEGCWLFIFVMFLSCFCHFFVIWFCIFLSFLFCGVIFCHFLSFVKSFFCHLLSHFFVIFLSFFCRFLVVFYFLALFIFLSFSHKDQASGEGGKPGLGNAKNCKK